MENTTKPQIHVSHLNTLSKCGIQFQFRYGKTYGVGPDNIIKPPGIAMVTGTAVHKSVEENMKKKIETGEENRMLPREEVRAIARDTFYNELEASGVMLTDEEAIDSKKTIIEATDQTVALAELHYDNLAATIHPSHVEKKFVIEMPNFPYDLAGQIDIRETNTVVRDTKTGKRSPADDAAKCMQLAMYALAEKVEYGEYPVVVSLDTLVKNKTPKIKICQAVPEDSWVDPLMNRIGNFIELMDTVKSGQTGFTPASPDPTNWVCTKNYCGYYDMCPYWSGR